MSLAGLAAHLPEIWPAAELEPEHQGAVGHGVHIFALCQEEDTHGNEIFMVVLIIDVLQELGFRLAVSSLGLPPATFAEHKHFL